MGDATAGRDNLLAFHMAAMLGRDPVLDPDRAGAHKPAGRYGSRAGLDIAIAVVAVDRHRQAAGGDVLANRRARLAEADHTDIGNGAARAARRETADHAGLEAGAFDRPRAARIVGARRQSRLVAGDAFGERLVDHG